MKRRAGEVIGGCEFCNKRRVVGRVVPCRQVEHMRGQSWAWACRRCAAANEEMKLRAAREVAR